MESMEGTCESDVHGKRETTRVVSELVLYVLYLPFPGALVVKSLQNASTFFCGGGTCVSSKMVLVSSSPIVGPSTELAVLEWDMVISKSHRGNKALVSL